MSRGVRKMSEDLNTAITRIEEQVKHIRETTDDIKQSVYGNGSKGLKTRVIVLEVKTWIILILMIPLTVVILRSFFGG
jgi:hypothetical protein